MKLNKVMLVSILLLTILFMGAVSAAENDTAASNVAVDTGDYVLTSPAIDEIDTGGDVNSSDSSSVDVTGQDNAATGSDVKSVENSKEILGASDEDVLGDDYIILTPQNLNVSELQNGNYKFEGTFSADDGFGPFISFEDCIVDGSEAQFVDIGIILNGYCRITGLTLNSTKILTNDQSPGAIVYVTNDMNVLDGITVNYAPTAEGDAYGIYVHESNNFQLLNSNITFTGSSLEEFYEYAMRMDTCDKVTIQGNTIIANLPILDVDYNKGDPGLATDLVLNTGIKEVIHLDIVNNTFIANVVDRNGDYPTLDCVMMEYCEYVNVTNNKFRESDFITNEGDANYLNVLDMYYSDNVLVQGNDISVETTGGTDNAGTSYPIQLTGPYEGVVIDGNTLYANCGGPALGIFSQNYYGDTEITVQNNNIDITGLPTDHSWGLVSGIELQDNVARVYNNTITTKSVTGSFEDGMNLYGISYAQALMDDHNYDIRGNTIETEGKYAIYLLKAQDTTITDNYLVSSTGEGDDTVYIRDADGNTIIENNHGAKEEPGNVVTQDNFYDFFDDEGNLLDTVEFDELIFKGEFEDLVERINIESPLTITGDNAILYNIGFLIDSADYVTLDNLKLVADTPLGTLINVVDSFYVDLINLDITYDGGSDEAVAIDVVGDDVNILNNTIFFESHVSDDSEFAVGLKITGSSDVLVDGNKIITQLPCVYVMNYDDDYYMMGSDKVDPVRLKDCSNLLFTNNFINSTTNDYSADFPTIQAIQTLGCHDSILDHNNISMIDEMTPAGMDNYLYGINFGYNSNVTFSNNYFNMSTRGGKDAAGTAYAFQGVESEVNIIGNHITSSSYGPNLGVYVASMYGGDSDLIINDNFINVTGSASSTGNWALVSGIEIQNGDAKIYNNTIYTYNVNAYDEYAYIYGISYAQWMYGDRSFDIQDNYVYTEGKYAISVINATSFNVEGNTLYAHDLTGDASVNPGSCADVNIKNNLPENETNIVTQDNFFTFFDDEGNLLDTVEFDELIFKGEFEDLVDYITLGEGLSIVGDGATLYNIGFIFDGDDGKLDNLKLVADEPLGALISVQGAYGITISNLDITYDGGDGTAVAIDVEGDNVKILNNTVFFESHVSSDAEFAVGLKLTGCTDALVDGNSITTKLPCVYCDNYDDDYYMMGSDKVDPVRLKDCSNLVFTNNFINSTTNDYSADFPTIQAIQIIGCHDSILDHNNISMIDEMTPAGMDNYLYGINFGYNTNVTFSNNYFNMSTSGGKDAAGTAYAFQGVESEVIIVGNNITSISNGPNLGIYVASMFGGDSDLVITDNFINVTGYASSTGSWALVSGIEIQNGDAKIYNNTIYTYNVNTYDEYAYMYGISYAQWMYGDRSFNIQDNTIYTDGKYTISIIDATYLNVEGNTLYAHDLAGDDSVYPGSCADVNIKNNLPETETNIVTQDNFYNFFDESGNLLDNVTFDELIFQGEFSDLASYITIDRALTITGDGAILNDIGFIIAGEDVTLDSMTLVANSDLGNLIDIADENAVISNMDISYTVDGAASAITVRPYANGVQILNNNIYFESTVDDYAADEVTTAICVSSGVSVFDEEDPIKGLVIDGNNITVVIPAFLADVYENEYYVMGLSAVNGVRINGAEDFEFTNNKLDVTTNRLARTTPTLQALYVASSSGLIDGNNILMIDTFTPAGKDVYLYALELINDEDLTISNNNFNLSTTGGKADEGSAYAILAIASDFKVTGNNITTVSNGPNLGIYFPSHMGSPCDALIQDNFINVTGLATATHDTGLVSGIEIQTGDVEIKGNTIYTYNIGEYAEGNYIYGISYAQDGSTPEVKITENTVITEGHYAISFLEVDDAVITGNYLISADLKGDGAVEIMEGSGNIVEDNLPELPYANISIEANTVWFGSNSTVSVNVPNATGTVTIEVNGKSYVVDLVDGVAAKEIPAEDLIGGENNITATYEGPEFRITVATAALYVVDGVVTQDTYLYYFNQDDFGKLFDYIPDGATLDFQGSIINPDQNITVQMNVNKPLNIISSTKDAYVDLNTTAGSLLGESPGNSFAITRGGSGTNVTGIAFHNTQLWISNTTNVVLDNISNVIEDQKVGSGVGATSVRDNSTYVTVKNSYFYTRNNGGSTTNTFSHASYCTFDNNTIKIEGNVGNGFYLNPYNVAGVPLAQVVNNYNNITNNRIYGKPGGGISQGIAIWGSYNLFENNTLYACSVANAAVWGATNPSCNNTFIGNAILNGGGLTAQPNSIVYNNNITGTLTTGAGSVAYDNTVGGKMTVDQGAHAYNNTVAGGAATGGTGAVIENNTIVGAVTINKVGTTFIGNNVTGTVTVSANDNVIKGNNITTAGNYTVDLGAKTGNNVTDNLLLAAELCGDASVKYTNENNLVKDNFPAKVTINVTADSVNFGDDVIVEVTGSVDGDYTVTVNNVTKDVTLVAGEAASVNFGVLDADTYNITVSYAETTYYLASVNDTESVTVNKASTVINVESDSINLKVFGEADAGATLDPAVAGNVTYTVSNSSVVKVEDGKIIALAVGSANITVSFAGDSNYAAAENKTISVTVSLKDASVSVENATLGLLVGENGTVVAVTTPEGLDVTFVPDESGVVSVDENGVVTALAEGTGSILVKVGGDGVYAENTTTVTVTVSKVPTEISVANATVALEATDEVVVSATLNPVDAGNLTYTSSNESVVKVEDGMIIAVGEGTAVITVSFVGDDTYAAAENKTIEVTVTLKDASVSVENATLELLVGEDGAIVAVTTPEGLDVTFVPDDSGVVSVDENGIVTALKEGSASIIVKVGGDGVYSEDSTTVTVTVTKVPTEISVVNATVDLTVNDEVASGASLTPADAGNLTYTSSNASVVKVEDGKIIAVGEGTAVITVSFVGDDTYAAAENKTIEVTVTLKDASVSVENATLELLVGDDGAIVAVTTPEGLDVTYVPDDSGVVSVDENGIVTALKEGSASIIVKVGGDGVYAENSTTVTVAVSKVPTEISVDSDSLDLVVGNESAVVATLNPSEAGKVTFTSSDDSIVTVDDEGNVVAVGEGTATITVGFAGDDKYAAAENVTVSVSVSAAPKPKENATMGVDAPEVTEGENATVTVTLPEDATGTVTVGNETVPVVNGTATVTIADLPVGNTTLPVTYSGDDKYNPVEDSVTITVDEKPVLPKENLTLEATADPITVGEDAVIVVTGFEDATGDVTVSVNGETYTAHIKDGEATFTVPGLTENATALISYAGDDNYNNASTAVDIVVSPKPKENATLGVDAPEVTEGENATVTVTLPEDATGTVTVGNETVPVVNGTATVTIADLPVGNTTLPVTYSGDDKYNSIEDSVTITVDEKPVLPKENLTLEATADPITVGEDAVIVVTGFEDATGDVTVSVNGETYTAPIKDGEATFTVPGLTENATALISYAGDDNYNNASTAVDIVVSPKPKENATYSIDAPEVTEGENATVIVTLPEDATGTVTVGNETVPVVNGTATVTIADLPAGNTTLPVTYSGDDKYNPIETEVNVSVKEDKSDIISAPDVTKYYKGPEKFIVIVTDYEGTPLADKTVIININGKDYTRTTDANGTASMAIGLPSNTYNVTVTVDNQSVNSVVTVLSTVNATDVVKMYRNATQYYATFLDTDGKYLADGTAVKFNINGVMYERKVSGDKGLAKLNINLPVGEYVITAINPVNGEMAANNITVLSTITENKDITKYYKNGTQYTVKVLGADGKAVGAGETVKFNINGVFYERTTNESGIAKMSINLPGGDYVITAEYKGCKVTNKVTVLPVLSAKDVTMKYRDGTKFVATLLDGQGKDYAGQTVQFNINGVMYNRVTDSSGQAKLNINLLAGEYIITSSYNGANIANKITITA